MTQTGSIPIQDIERSRKATARRIREALAPIGDLKGVSIYLRTVEGETLAVIEEGGCVFEESAIPHNLPPTDASTVCFALEDGVEVLVRDENCGPVTVKLVGALLQGSLRALEAETREELLLEELGANWESLEALYEISTDALRSGDMNDALKRLIARLTTLQNGLHSALFIRREGLFHTLVSTDHDLNTLTASQLGPVEKAVRDMQVVLVNRLAQTPDEHVCWRNAASLAAAPFAWEGSIGFVVVWNEERNCEFDSSVFADARGNHLPGIGHDARRSAQSQAAGERAPGPGD